MKPIIIHGDRKYQINYHITSGGLGHIFHGTAVDDSSFEVAIKATEFDNADDESSFIKKLQGVPGFAIQYWSGDVNRFEVIVQELLGPSLETLLDFCDRRLSEKTILLIAEKAIVLLEAMHAKGVVHRDIKAENFVMGSGKMGNELYLIDFGLAKHFEYDDPPAPVGRRVTRGHVRKMRETIRRRMEPGVGTPYMMPVNAHQDIEQCPLDDLESLLYMIRYLADGKLLWHDQINGQYYDTWLTCECKAMATVEELFSTMPSDYGNSRALMNAFAEFKKVINSYHWQEKPNYKYLRGIFTRALQSEGYKRDNVFSWTQKRFEDMWKEIKEKERTELTGEGR